MPETSRCSFFVPLAVGETHQLELHPPGSEKIDPVLAGIGSGGAQSWFAEQANAFRFQIGDRRVHVVDVKGEMMAADIAVLRRLEFLSRRFVLKNLEVRPVFAAEEAQLAHDGARMDIQMSRHPVAIGHELADLEHALAADHIDKESGRLFQVGDSETDVLGTA